MNIFSKLMCIACFVVLPSDSKVLIFTYSYNRPDFIEIQHKTFKKFLMDEYEFIVFNDATAAQIIKEIEDMCNKLAIKCINIPQEIHSTVYNASARNCDVVNFSLETLGFAQNDVVALIDSDMFLIKEFSIKKYVCDFALAGCPQQRENINYIWIALVFLNMATMPNKNTINFGCGLIDDVPVDSGGFSHYYLKNNPDALVRHFEKNFYIKDFFCQPCLQNEVERCEHLVQKMKDLDFNAPLINLACQSPNSVMELFIDNTFLHYRAGSNWNNESKSYHAKKTKLLNSFIDSLIAG